MSIRWMEVDPRRPRMSLAGRHDEPVTSRGAAAVATVQFAVKALNQSSLHSAIRRELSHSRQPRTLFRNVPTSPQRGLIARAIIGVRDNRNDMLGRYLVQVVFYGPFQDSAVGIRTASHTHSMFAGHHPADTQENRWFWGLRV